jgi:hypothetical protein
MAKSNENKTFPRGILSALFLDPEATAIVITHYNEQEEPLTDVCQVDPESPMYQDLIKLTTLEAIEEDTIENTKVEVAQWQKFEAWEKGVADSLEPTISTATESTIEQLDVKWNLKNLLKNITEDFTKEDLFALKLDVFATEAVTNSDDKVKRSAIRKATTPLEILVCYNDML